MDCIKTFSRSVTLQSHPIDFSNASESYFVTVDEFDRNTVGSKSLNLKELKTKLDFILTPRAFALPYGALQKVLNSPENVSTVLPALNKAIVNLSVDLESEEVSTIFNRVRWHLTNMKVPAELSEELSQLWPSIDTQKGELVQSPLKELYESAGLERCWTAICGVWASVFAMRPWISLAKANRSFMELNMGVLVQELVKADYAFVLHTKNPFKDTKSQDTRRQMYGEIVIGLGEVLVANYPGRALSFVKFENEPAEVVAFPAKSEALLAQGSLIFRSDSNGEDLKGFAGAGLFESLPAVSPKHVVVCYEHSALVTDERFRQRLIDRIGDVAFRIEDAFGVPMDIEGCVSQDQIVIVQARPQV
eukprot:Protomagalhaensia_wolfi_Nauph_80__942@NODE_1542_length_1480_cov_19_401804_g1197_i0_p1_GENE_NODE_1542_length_1480_cov_19_401804_g1197_i0NODE_1542_length_1480_cov_19_401804_g1197_i0_p1_ORF_typecomplete_len362_score59_41PPDK_N/PF01326_19/7_6e24PPDK_N/PF01326_19/0_00096PPDK_N/PF01326_19/9_5e09_NODE_1542_length_1480_cov_19_401804_g1197_i01741259